MSVSSKFPQDTLASMTEGPVAQWRLVDESREFGEVLLSRPLLTFATANARCFKVRVGHICRLSGCHR